MSKLARILVVGAALAATSFAGMTTLAQAHANDEHTINRHRALGQVQLPVVRDHAARRPPTERQVGESYRHRQVASQQTATGDAVEQFRRGERASQEQTTADATLRRVLAQEHSYSPKGTPAQVTVPVPAGPSGQPGWLVAWLGVLTAVLALSGGLAVMAAKRARRKAQVGQAA